jgi:hypothetical protein
VFLVWQTEFALGRIKKIQRRDFMKILAVLFSLLPLNALASELGAAELYRASQSVTDGACSSGSCSTQLKNLLCTWNNDASEGDRHSCSFAAPNGKEETLEGAKAKRLAKAVKAALGKRADVSCGMGTCGFRDNLDVRCQESRGKGKKAKLAYDCQITTAKADSPVPAKRARAQPSSSPYGGDDEGGASAK